MLKADLHVHTEYSMDCSTPLAEIVRRCGEVGISCLAVADHGTVEGALRLQAMAPFRVIVAEEILTPDGEIMGMFLKETIPSGSSLAETISRIKAQGGLVCIPHPFDLYRQALGGRIPADLIPQVDIVEVLNARGLLPRATAKARAFAAKHGLAQSAGSDAHTAAEIGNAFVEMPEYDGRQDFLAALAQGRVGGHKTSPTVHFASTWTRLKKRFNGGQ
ncbi:MAG: PHP-associated domain-containing protein [Chloroflexota bacterium]